MDGDICDTDSVWAGFDLLVSLGTYQLHSPFADSEVLQWTERHQQTYGASRIQSPATYLDVYICPWPTEKEYHVAYLS